MALNIDINLDPVNHDPVATDTFIRANGVQLYHYKAVKCPIGMVGALEMSQVGHDHHQCSNGFIYKLAGTVTAMYTNNPANVKFTEVGLLDGSTVQITFPRFYDDNPEKQIYVQLFDRFYIKDLVVLASNTQLFEAHITGVEKLTYKAEQVEYLIDSTGKEYSAADFIVQDGNIVWTGSNRPEFDANLNRGVICSTKYLYTPYFYATRLLHEVRIVHRADFKTGKRVVLRAPYAALISREYVKYKHEQADDPQNNTGGTMLAPADSMFGPK